MNKLLRLLLLRILARWREPCSALGPCRTELRVLPSDLDVQLHMNNGVYFSLLDLGRVDLLLRSGLLAKVDARGWFSVVAAETIQFKKALRLFEAFAIETRVVGWDERAFFLEQRFLRRSQPEQVAAAVVRVRFLKHSGGSVKPEEVLQLGGLPTRSPELPESIRIWNSTLAGAPVATRAVASVAPGSAIPEQAR